MMHSVNLSMTKTPKITTISILQKAPNDSDSVGIWKDSAKKIKSRKYQKSKKWAKSPKSTNSESPHSNGLHDGHCAQSNEDIDALFAMQSAVYHDDDADPNDFGFALSNRPPFGSPVTSLSATPYDAEEQQIADLVGADAPWSCEKCTFVNAASALHCEMCYFSRFEVKNLPAQWQWKAANRWITYGIPETTEIESAFTNGAGEVALSKGWFASNRHRYKIVFGNTSNHNAKQNGSESNHYQINGQTQTQREVRRIGTDDEGLFRKMALKELDAKDRKCMICLAEFDEEDAAEGAIVQLSTCKNHGFHKECIAQWVQLKGNCPLCRIDVDI